MAIIVPGEKPGVLLRFTRVVHYWGCPEDLGVVGYVWNEKKRPVRFVLWHSGHCDALVDYEGQRAREEGYLCGAAPAPPCRLPLVSRRTADLRAVLACHRLMAVLGCWIEDYARGRDKGA